MEALTKLSDEKELERYLSYGKWGLSDDDIVRLNKDEEMKQRVSLLAFTFFIMNHQFSLMRKKNIKIFFFFCQIMILFPLKRTILFSWYSPLCCYKQDINKKYFFYTGKSLSEALVFTTTNPRYGDRLFIELWVQIMKIASSVLVVYIIFSECRLKQKQKIICVHNISWACNFHVLNT